MKNSPSFQFFCDAGNRLRCDDKWCWGCFTCFQVLKNGIVVHRGQIGGRGGGGLNAPNAEPEKDDGFLL